MAIRLAKKDRVRVNVVCEVPRDKGAGYQKESFVAVIKKLYGSEAEDFSKRRVDMTVLEQLQELVLGLEQIKDEDGKDIPFSAELIEQIGEIDYYWLPLYEQCIAVQNELARKEMERKN